MKKLVLSLMLVGLLFGETEWSAFGYTVNKELNPKK
jgi:hypothetical protein